MKELEKLVEASGGTYSFDGDTAYRVCCALFKEVTAMGLNPMVKEDFKKGLLEIFNIEVVNLPSDFDSGRYILLPNHVSDVDGFVLGLFHDNIKIVAKSDWTNHEALGQFRAMHYDMFGLDRTSMLSLRDLMRTATHYFLSDNESKHFLVFSQGTISDFNKNCKERVSTLAQKISDKTGVKMLPVYLEQVSIHQPTRFVFAKPMALQPEDDFREVWLNAMKEIQSTLNPAPRTPKLSFKHSNNNTPGEQFFAASSPSQS